MARLRGGAAGGQLRAIAGETQRACGSANSSLCYLGYSAGSGPVRRGVAAGHRVGTSGASGPARHAGDESWTLPACGGLPWSLFGRPEPAGERALALWGDTGGVWVQRFDLARGSSLGAPHALGKLTEADLPYVFALPDGDAALFGVLPDGRVSFARGSEVAARRIAPKLVGTSGRPGVGSLAASATAEGLVLLVLRRPGEQDAHAAELQMEAELHWFDARGEQLRAPLLWQTRVATEARLAACGDQLFLAWNSAEGVLVTRVSAAGQAREEAPFPAPQAGLEGNRPGQEA